MSKKQDIIVVLAPYFYDHITPAARREAARDVLKVLRPPPMDAVLALSKTLRVPAATLDLFWCELVDRMLTDKV